MAKKKSKSQKMKKNLKRKLNKQQVKEMDLPILKEEKKKKEQKSKKVVKEKVNSTPKRKNNNKPAPKKTVVDAKKVIYNVPLTNPDLLRRKKELLRPKKEAKFFDKALYFIRANIHILFNVLLIVSFLVMIVGLFRVKVFATGFILFVSGLILFLSIIAISYNRFISGKIFSVLLVSIMSLVIYYLQYNYDFVRNLNTFKYEYKTYYVVTFENIQNKNVYCINDKKVALSNNNTKNIERKLNTIVDKVDYVEYDDLDDMIKDFYNYDYKALIVTENEYKYLMNNRVNNSREIKVLYDFIVNAKK